VARGAAGTEEKETHHEASQGLPFPQIIAAFAPQQTGLTVNPQPRLYWYLSSDWDWEIEFTLNEVGAPEPLLELTLGLPPDKDRHLAGFHSLNLADYDIRLEKDKEYEWFIAIVPDPMERSGDLVTSATIRLVDPPKDLTQQLASVAEVAHYQVYAKNGLWYEAADALSQQIEKNPQDNTLRLQRAALNQQVKMHKVAIFDNPSLKPN
jgi:hypothetical protein